MQEDGELITRLLLFETTYSAVRQAHHDDEKNIHNLPDAVKQTLDRLEKMGINAWGL